LVKLVKVSQYNHIMLPQYFPCNANSESARSQATSTPLGIEKRQLWFPSSRRSDANFALKKIIRVQIKHETMINFS
jgi:hypothetical protein